MSKVSYELVDDFLRLDKETSFYLDLVANEYLEQLFGIENVTFCPDKWIDSKNNYIYSTGVIKSNNITSVVVKCYIDITTDKHIIVNFDFPKAKVHLNQDHRSNCIYVYDEK